MATRANLMQINDLQNEIHYCENKMDTLMLFEMGQRISKKEKNEVAEERRKLSMNHEFYERVELKEMNSRSQQFPKGTSFRVPGGTGGEAEKHFAQPNIRKTPRQDENYHGADVHGESPAQDANGHDSHSSDNDKHTYTDNDSEGARGHDSHTNDANNHARGHDSHTNKKANGDSLAQDDHDHTYNEE